MSMDKLRGLLSRLTFEADELFARREQQNKELVLKLAGANVDLEEARTLLREAREERDRMQAALAEARENARQIGLAHQYERERRPSTKTANEIVEACMAAAASSERYGVDVSAYCTQQSCVSAVRALKDKFALAEPAHHDLTDAEADTMLSAYHNAGINDGWPPLMRELMRQAWAARPQRKKGA